MVSKASDDLPDPLTPVMMISWPRRQRDVDVLEVVGAGAANDDLAPGIVTGHLGVAMQVENSGGTGTVHRSAAVRSVQPRQA